MIIDARMVRVPRMMQEEREEEDGRYTGAIRAVHAAARSVSVTGIICPCSDRALLHCFLRFRPAE